MSYPVLIITKNHVSLSSTIFLANTEEEALLSFEIITKNEYALKSKGIPTYAILLFERTIK
jgi:hypothetical protein